ncbi:MAG TPA: WYL domain-containing protein [Longimicrobiaceae bacterium]|nr:WYL domain-containing protein [Longimicrobiaceae bacterium]
MPESPAVEQLQRLLYLIPAAVREGGVSYAEAAEALGVTPEQIRRDAEELADRCFSHPAGSVDEFGIGMETDRVEIWTAGEFRRPARLTARETLALELGVRLVAADRAESERDWSDRAGSGRVESDRSEIRELGKELQVALAFAPAAEDATRFALRWRLDEGADPVAGLRGLVLDAVRECRRVRVTYVKPADREPSERVLEPLELVFAEGRWYALAGEAVDEGAAPVVKAFRLDRVLEAAVLETSFERPEGFDPGEYLADGRVFRPTEELRVPIRFAAGIAPMVLEVRAATPIPGPVVEELLVSDPGWLVAQVLFHAGDAEVLETSCREWVAAGAEQVLNELR